MRQFDFSVDPGESFYVWARLLGTADQLGEVNALSTLTASFTNIDGLTPAATDLPEPAAAWLLLCGLAFLGAHRVGRFC